MRFPVIWERHVALGDASWAWADAALERLHVHGIRPIIGLMHHGSGPRDVSLVDAELAPALAAFARVVAERYPWVWQFTPINEPLTTARFSALYGLWHPHQTSPRAFARALLNQIHAISAAMRAVREITPHAELVQTEDLGKSFAARQLQYQADFENERRWLTFDLLSGCVTSAHPMSDYLEWAGVTRDELGVVAESACPPATIGINHYLTSERFLDVDLDRYPIASHGGNEHERYADVEAVRVLVEGVAGPRTLLREAWDRYQRPIAVTEAHLGCTREQQLRWLRGVWDAAVELREDGVDVRAVTAWSAFGAYDWDTLLTRAGGTYEPGLFDCRAPEPRRTALARMAQTLAAGSGDLHPAASGRGWWERSSRLTFAADALLVASNPDEDRHDADAGGASPRRLLILGAAGTLGRAVARACEQRGLAYVGLDRRALDVCDDAAIDQALATMHPWGVVNCAGFVRVDDAERERAACHAANARGAQAIARACDAHGVKLVTFSSDLVFDGAKREPYVESDRTRPLNEYGRSKAAAEAMVLEAQPTALVVRTAAFFGDDDDANFVTIALRALAAGERFVAIDDLIVSPTYVPDLVDATLDLAIDDECGVWHLASVGAVTWASLARRAATAAGVDTAGLDERPHAALSLAARRPVNSALSSERASIMPSLDDALARYVGGRPWQRTNTPPAARVGAHSAAPNDSHSFPCGRPAR